MVAKTGPVTIEDKLTNGSTLPWWLFLVPIAYLLVPALLGTTSGRAIRSDNPQWRAFGRVVAGRDPAPRAWDFLFSSRPAAAVRLKLKDGGWLGGFFGADSYASGYPEEPQ